jgi:hypothetical protein
MHRWVWDLHYPSPTVSHHEYPIAAVPYDTPRSPLGPLALPGEYSVRLTVNGHTSTALLTVKMDPRVNTPPAGIEQQFTLEMRLASGLTGISGAVAEAKSVLDQIHKIGNQPKGELAESIKALEQKVTTILRGSTPEVSGAPPEPTLTREATAVGALYGGIGQADAAPTVAQVKAVADTERDLAAVMKRWEEIKQSDIPALNRQLKKANLVEIRLDAMVQAGETQGDLE